jgi:preprotein translocase subunit SecG
MIKIIIYILLSAHVLCSVLLTFFVLMQRPKSEGLGTAFGSAVTDSLFGAGTSDVLTKMTISLGAFFFGVTLLLAILYAHPSGTSKIQKELIAPAAETVPSVPATPAIPQAPIAPAPAPAQ